MARTGPKKRTAANSRKKPPASGLWAGFALAAHEPDEVRREFSRLVKAVESAGTRDRVDPRFVEAAAQLHALKVEADADLRRDGLTLTTANGTMMPHPMLGVRNALVMRLRALYNDMGLTASSAKLGTPAADAPAASDGGWAGLLSVTG